MGQDWFADNAPKEADWFAANAPATPPPSLLSRVQNAFDNLTTVTAGQQQIPSWMNPAVGAALNQAQKFGAGTVQALGGPIVHPIQTLESIGNSIAHPINTAQAVAQSAIENPAQTLGNIVGGAVLGEAAAPAAEAAANVVGKPAMRAALLGRTPEAAYESALKPSTTLSEAERTALAQTGIQNEIPVSRGGIETLNKQIDKLNVAIKDQIAADPMRPISTVRAVRNLDDVRARFADQVTPQPDLNEIDQVQSNFLANPKIQPQGEGPGPASLPASQAQAMKIGTYRALGDKAFGELKGANIEAQKSLARGLKDEIATQFPEINDLNSAEGKLLDLQPVLERAVARNANHQFFGLGTAAIAAGTRALTGNGPVAAAAATLKAVVDDPFVKSRLAIAVSKGGKIPYAQAVARVGAYSSALGSTAQAASQTSDDQTANK